jgi:hypothetical protein
MAGPVESNVYVEPARTLEAMRTQVSSRNICSVSRAACACYQPNLQSEKVAANPGGSYGQDKTIR